LVAICHTPQVWTPQPLHFSTSHHQHPSGARLTFSPPPEESKLVSLPVLRLLITPRGVKTRQYPGSVINQLLTNAGVSPSGFLFSFLFFLKRISVTLLKLWAVEDYPKPWDPVPKGSYHHLGLSPMRPNELWTCPDDGAAMTQAHTCQRSSCGSVRRGRGGDRYSQRRS